MSYRHHEGHSHEGGRRTFDLGLESETLLSWKHILQQGSAYTGPGDGESVQKRAEIWGG